MKISIHGKTGCPVIELDESDLVEASQILVTMETPGWGRLMQYWAVAREALIERGKSGTKMRSKFDLSGAKWATLDGFDECVAIPSRIIERAKEFIKSKKEAEANGRGYEKFNGE